MLYFTFNLLQENLKRNNMTDMIAFVDPGMIGARNCDSSARRSRYLSNRFKTCKERAILFTTI